MGAFTWKGTADVASKQDAGTRVVLRDQLGEAFTYTDAKGVVVEMTALVAGSLSALYRKAEADVRNAMLKRGRSLVLNNEALEKQALAVIAACVLEWDLREGDKPIPCTKENVIQLLTAAPWIRGDIEAAMNDAARFL